MPVTDVSGQSPHNRNFDMRDLSGTLLGGVLLSTVLIVAGLIWNAAVTGSFEVNYTVKGTNLTGFVATTVRQIEVGLPGLTQY